MDPILKAEFGEIEEANILEFGASQKASEDTMKRCISEVQMSKKKENFLKEDVLNPQGKRLMHFDAYNPKNPEIFAVQAFEHKANGRLVDEGLDQRKLIQASPSSTTMLISSIEDALEPHRGI
ncbi:hypothetical protein KSP39_PZI017621 [Platanthera zijinensis]|uniref:Uncharacterized protein n=1 Tax=Platanthera zijinensis TaxID=2320716 RepID=A0AAP0B550_9ASPA